jgi:CheY-like chemotaxis protein
VPGKILVIEDNPENLELMLYLLRAFGHQTCSARDWRGWRLSSGKSHADYLRCAHADNGWF